MSKDTTYYIYQIRRSLNARIFGICVKLLEA